MANSMWWVVVLGPLQCNSRETYIKGLFFPGRYCFFMQLGLNSERIRIGDFPHGNWKKAQWPYIVPEKDLFFGIPVLDLFSSSPIQKLGILSARVLDFLVFRRSVSILRKQSFPCQRLEKRLLKRRRTVMISCRITCLVRKAWQWSNSACCSPGPRRRSIKFLDKGVRYQ